MLRRFSLITLLSLAACGDDNQPADAGSTRDAGRARDLDCPGVFDCVERCRDGDDVCVDACVERSTRSAAPDVDDLLACALSNDCEGDEACLALNCTPEVLACAGEEAFDGGVPGAGSELDCSEVFDCVDACRDGNESCIDACLERGSSATQSLVEDVLTCAQRNACDDEACLERRCSAELLSCAGSPALDGGTRDAGSRPDAGDAGVSPDAGPSCERAGKPELTGPISGLVASYSPGDPIDIGVPVDQDTARVIVGIYEVGSTLYLGGTAKDVAGSSTATLSFFAGVAGGETGTFYLSVELCSTSVCTTPFVRNTYQRADRSAARAADETYVQTRENVGGPASRETCASSIPVQTFKIE